MEDMAKAKRELEELYLGVPDDSVNLTFQYLAQVKQQQYPMSSDDQQKSSCPKIQVSSSPLTKLPSLDFNRALEESTGRPHHHQVRHDTGDSSRIHLRRDDNSLQASRGRDYANGKNHATLCSPRRLSDMAYDSESVISSMSLGSMSPYQERGGRRRPGIPHSNICTICSVYIYIFRHRCLVCGRVYCRQCVSIGMGEKTEGRKCIECLGRRFSLRYIQRAGQIGCCMRYPSLVKQQELKWADKGPKMSGSALMSRSTSPVNPPRPTKAHASTRSSPPSFVISSTFSAYSPTNHPIPF